MGTLNNLPQPPTMMVLAARKSFSFTVSFIDVNKNPLNLEASTSSFTVGEQQYSTTPIFTIPSTSIDVAKGIVLFNVQASQLDLTPGVYPWEVVVISEGYSVMAINGELEIEESYEMGSLTQVYDTAPSSYGLTAQLKHNHITVTTNSLVIGGPQGPQGEPGVDGNPWGPVTVAYDDLKRITSLVYAGQTYNYTYHDDNTIAFDERGGVTRLYVYTDGLLTSIEPQTGP